MAGEANRVANPGGTGLDAVAGLLKLIGGERTRQSVSTDTGALDEAIRQLTNPTDGTKQLESIFQTAAGNIPKFQAAFGNAVGARSGGNSSVDAALRSLLQQTTLAGQKQIADQEAQRLQTLAGAGANKANATRAVSQTQDTNLGKVAKVIGGLQLAGKFGITDKLRNAAIGTAGGGITGAGAGGLTTADLPSFNFEVPTNLFNAGDTGFSIANEAPALDFGTDLLSAGGNYLTDAAANFSGGIGAGTDVASEGGGFLSDVGNAISSGWDRVTDFFGFADGGLVGRDGVPEDLAKTSYSSKMTRHELPGYADGGLVRAGGGRRSSAPTYTPDILATTSALNIQPTNVLRALLNPGATQETDSPFTESAGGNATGGQATGAVSGPSGGPSVQASLSQALSIAKGIANPTPLGLLGLVSTINSLNAANAAAESANLDSNPAVNGVAPGLEGMVSATPGPEGTGGLAAAAAAAAAEAAAAQGLSAAAIGAAAQAAADAALGGSTGLGGIGADSGAGGIGNSDAGSTGGGADTGGPAGSGGDGTGSGGQLANGGPVRGKGTETSDSINARLSKNEYVIPADVVDAMGVEFFDMLRNKFHTMTSEGAR